MINLKEPKEFISESCIIDVRSPGEYAHAHIPSAHNLPLFSDHERALVGTAYHQEGREKATKLGLKLVQPKLCAFVETADKVSRGGPVALYCWRGGMRSQSVALLLNQMGMSVSLLQGGYKKFRHMVLEEFEKDRSLLVLSGATGSGKTAVLHHLEEMGEPVIDLEHIAAHRGSVFGHLGKESQPSQEQFENRLAMQLLKLKDKTVWIEDESRMIGRCTLPIPLFERMLAAPLIQIEKPIEERIKEIIKEYGHYSNHKLVACTEKIRRRLGGERTQAAIDLGTGGNQKEAVRTLLSYYDKTYAYGVTKRSGPVQKIATTGLTNYAWAKLLIESAKQPVESCV